MSDELADETWWEPFYYQDDPSDPDLPPDTPVLTGSLLPRQSPSPSGTFQAYLGSFGIPAVGCGNDCGPPANSWGRMEGPLMVQLGNIGLTRVTLADHYEVVGHALPPGGGQGHGLNLLSLAMVGGRLEIRLVGLLATMLGGSWLRNEDGSRMHAVSFLGGFGGVSEWLFGSVKAHLGMVAYRLPPPGHGVLAVEAGSPAIAPTQLSDACQTGIAPGDPAWAALNNGWASLADIEGQPCRFTPATTAFATIDLQSMVTPTNTSACPPMAPAPSEPVFGPVGRQLPENRCAVIAYEEGSVRDIGTGVPNYSPVFGLGYGWELLAGTTLWRDHPRSAAGREDVLLFADIASQCVYAFAADPDRGTPLAVWGRKPGARSVTAISTEGGLSCWGCGGPDGAGLSYVDSGQCNAPGGTDWVDVSVGRDHSCALNKAGEIHCWGCEGDTDEGPCDVPP